MGPTHWPARATLLPEPSPARRPDTNTNVVSADPAYQSVTFSAASFSNTNFLRPGNSAAYAGKHTGGTNLVGGAGGSLVPVSVSAMQID